MPDLLTARFGGLANWAKVLVGAFLLATVVACSSAARSRTLRRRQSLRQRWKPLTETESATIKVGVLHSLSVTMSISETAVKDATLLDIEEINASGGVLGKQLEPVIEDGGSDWPTFAEKARKLIQSDQVVVVFGGWTSASRKAMLPVFEANNGLLFYPVQYEGLESSPNIFYTGATTNQQIVPAVEYLLE